MFDHDPRRRRARAAAALMMVASVCGCASMKTSQSQLFGAKSNCQSASVTYRVERQAPARSASGAGWARFFSPGDQHKRSEHRVTMLAVRYPHPSGRAGFARLECITATIPVGETPQSPGWLARVGKLADETMPGLTMAEGIHEAMGLDVPISELDGMLARLQQPESGPRSPEPSAPSPRQVVQVSYEIDGHAHPERDQRVPELDRLIARVRREGSVISHSTSVAESLVGRQAASETAAPPAVVPAQHVAAPVAVPVAGGSIQPVSHEQPLATSAPAMWRLPPVHTSAP